MLHIICTLTVFKKKTDILLVVLFTAVLHVGLSRNANNNDPNNGCKGD